MPVTRLLRPRRGLKTGLYKGPDGERISGFEVCSEPQVELSSSRELSPSAQDFFQTKKSILQGTECRRLSSVHQGRAQGANRNRSGPMSMFLISFSQSWSNLAHSLPGLSGSFFGALMLLEGRQIVTNACGEVVEGRPGCWRGDQCGPQGTQGRRC